MNTGQIVRAKSERDFTMLSNKLLQDCNITIEEKGLLVYLLSLPTDWVLYKKSLPEKTMESKGTIDRVFKQLQEKGYILSVKVIDPKTKVFKGWNHIVYEEPTLTESDIKEEPRSTKADVGQSMPIQIHTNTNTNINTNTNDIYTAKSKKKGFVPPTLDEVKVFFRDNGYAEEIAIRAFKHYEENDWKDSYDNKVLNWKSKMRNNWFKDQYKIQESKIKVRDIFGGTHFKTQEEINKAEKGFFNKI
jgi:hypothetical protein